MKYKGAVAAGHAETVKVAEQVLRDGGNAFDAVVAGHFVACVVEPVLASLGGGGYLTFRDSRGTSGVYDFFVQTPRHKPAIDELDFYPIQADFGTASQEFHIGRASVATPGSLKGMFAIQREQGSMPMSRLVEPAIALAKDGVALNAFQAYILDIVKPIYRVDKQSRDAFVTDAGDIKKVGERYYKPGFAQVLDALVHEGEDLFYRGEIAQLIATVTEDGGCLRREDLERYELIRRRPLISDYASHRIITNPLPSSGGALIHFALQLLSAYRPGQYRRGSYEQLSMLAATMKATNRARLEVAVSNSDSINDGISALLDKEFLAQFLSDLKNRAQALRGTTHISVVDAKGNAAAMTVSNGEGCGHMVPGTGIMLNNMLGEEDLNPQGFHRWQTNQRMTSMMSPTLIQDNAGNVTALGSGGSNRIRTTILQLLVNRLDFGMSLEEAIIQPRIHLEGETLNIEGGIREDVVQQLMREYPDHVLWPEHNLFFGGAHAVAQTEKGFEAFGDPRRGGEAVII